MRLKLTCLLVLAAQAHAQTQVQAGARADQALASAQVVVNGGKTDVEAGRDVVAGKIIIGKQAILDSGVQNAGELLRREPAISIGKDGRLGLLGLPGYTQVLVDGASYPGDPFSIDLVHIERIEIVKTSTAATGPIGIAGTINIVRKKTARQAYTQLRTGASVSGGRAGADLGWSSNQLVANGPLGYNLSLSARRSTAPNRSRYTGSGAGVGDAVDSAVGYDGERAGRSKFQSVMASGEFSWTLGPAHKLSFSPDAGRIGTPSDSVEGRRWRDGRGFSVRQDNPATMTSYSLPLGWTWRIDDDSSLGLRLNRNRSEIDTDTAQDETWFDGAWHGRRNGRRIAMTGDFLNLDYHTELKGGHDITAGAKLARNDRESAYADLVDGVPDRNLAVFGRDSRARVDSWQLFAQDEWRIDRTLALNLGAAAERRDYRLDEGPLHNRTRFTMWSPSAHLSKKLAGSNKRQFRLSLARSFQAPEVDRMLLHPRIGTFAPCLAQQPCGANTIDNADGSGNPQLRPERALGLNASYTHGVGKDSELVLEWYMRTIRDKIGSDLRLENVAWASAPRYVYRPANLGEARLRGVNLEGRLSGKDLWKGAPSMEAHGSVGWAHSALSDLPGPDNRLAGQTPWRAKLGGSYTPPAVPLKLGIESSYLPGDWVRDNLRERVYQSNRFTLGASANWKLDANARLVLNLDNLVHKTTTRIEEYQGAADGFRVRTDSANDARISLRFETRL